MKIWFYSCIIFLSMGRLLYPGSPSEVCELAPRKAAYQEYVELIAKYPTLGPVGNYLDKEIELVMDPSLMPDIEKRTGRSIGIVAQDNYWIWLNDPVRFPNGRYGVYGRMLWKSSLSGAAGVAVLILSKEGKIGLNCNYRHAKRSWELEMPRGGREPQEDIYEAARREVKEETGMIIDKLVLLGTMIPDSGTIAGESPVFLAHISSQESATPEESESIISIPFYTIEEIKQGFVQGCLPVTIEDKVQNVNLRDPFLAFAFLQAELQHLLPVEK